MRLAEAKLARDPDAARNLIVAAAAEAASANEELRELARGLHPSILSGRGLGPALEALGWRAPVPVEVDAMPDERLPRPVEVAAYYVVAEALTNVAKYARATAAQVRVVRDNGLAVVEIADDYIGGADVSTGSLRGLRDRGEALYGRLAVTSAGGEGTIIRAEFPLRLTFAPDAEDDARPAPQPERAAECRGSAVLEGTADPFDARQAAMGSGTSSMADASASATAAGRRSATSATSAPATAMPAAPRNAAE